MSKSLKCLLALAIAGAAANSAMAADGQINFTGKIVSATCTPGGPNANAKNLDVNLGDVSIDQLNDAAAGTAPVKVAVELQIDCTAKDAGVNGVIMTFDGFQTDTNNTQLLANTGGAKGVGIGLFAGGVLQNLSSGRYVTSAQLTGAASPWIAKFDLSAGYVKAVGGATPDVTAGNVIGTLPFTLTYN